MVDICVLDSLSPSIVEKGRPIRIRCGWSIVDRSGDIIHEISNTATLEPLKKILKEDAAYYEILASLQVRNSEMLVNYLTELLKARENTDANGKLDKPLR